MTIYVKAIPIPKPPVDTVTITMNGSEAAEILRFLQCKVLPNETVVARLYEALLEALK